MSTYLANNVPVTNLNVNGLGIVGSLIWGTKWGGGYGTGAALKYSFVTNQNLFAPGYVIPSGGTFASFQPLSLVERAGVVAALGVWDAFANVSFSPAGDNATVVGDLRFAQTTFNAPGSIVYGAASYPSANPKGGDVWLDNTNWYDPNFPDVTPGDEEFFTLLHEIGHALGLKHSFEGPPGSPRIMPTSLDWINYTVMSYTEELNGYAFPSLYPTTPMYYDLMAIHRMYGRPAHNPGNTTYTFNQNNTYWQTIDDTGGIDTIVAVSLTFGNRIDLRIGQGNVVGQPIQFFSQFTGQPGPQHELSVIIGPGTNIENATTGAAPDTLVGNGLNNVLKAGANADRLTGLGGNDSLQGQDGHDLLTGGPGNDVLIGGPGGDTATGGPGRDMFVFNDRLPKGLGIRDEATDFNVADDTVKLIGSAFPNLGPAGTLAAARFFIGLTATLPGHRVGYDPGTGFLAYDENGSLPGGGFQIAVLPRNLLFTNADVVVG